VTGWYNYPSITTILGNDPKKRRALAEWRLRIGAEAADAKSKRAASRGTAVHSLMEKYVLGEEIELPTNPVRARAFKNLSATLDANLEEVYGVECPLYSHLLEAAGRCDLVGKWAGRRAVIDFKTADHEKDESDIVDYFLQTTAYAVMFEERTGIRIPGVVVVIACDSGATQVFMRSASKYYARMIEAVETRRPR
jgi:ATP-dependent exoDNAse (exonuclease V) beta subunit